MIYDMLLNEYEGVVIFLDEEKNITKFNKHLENLVKLTAPEIFSKNLFDLFKQQHISLPFSSEELSLVKEGKSLQKDKATNLDHQKYLIEWKVIYSKSEKPTETACFLILAKFLDKEMVTQNKYPNNENYFFNVINNLPEYIYWKDKKLVYQGCNKHVAEYLGLKSPNDIIGKTDNDFGWNEERIDFLNLIDKTILENGNSNTTEDIIPSADGRVRIMLTTKLPSYSIQGEIDGILGISTDITELKEVEKKISQANASKSGFLNAIDHMIRNPLSCILGLAQLLEKNKTAKKQSDIIHTIIDSTKEITSTLVRVRSYLDLEEGSLEDIHSTFILRDFFQIFADKYKPLAEEKSLTFIFDYNAILPDWVSGNSAFLSQILHNLLSNAIKYTAKGHVKLTVDWYGLAGEEMTILLLVEDTGQGIRKENQACLFNLFNQPSLSAEAFSEPGLSLSISAKMLEIMGGTIFIESIVDQGTLFTVSIPLIRVKTIMENTHFPYDKDGEKSTKPKLKRDKKSLLRVLIIEDNPVSLRVLKMILEEHYHCEIEGVYNLKDAMKKNAADYDIILVDINLPDGTGTDFIKFWKQKLKDKSAPMVAVTSHITEEEKIAIIEAGAVDVIEKPVDLQVLIMVVDAYVFEENGYLE
jgi:two-component system aerobic respiration control sensor histidine kinase ArcB